MSANDLKVEINVEFINAELECIVCKNKHFENSNIVGDEYQTIEFENSVFEDHKCPHCGCNIFNVTCSVSMKFK